MQDWEPDEPRPVASSELLRPKREMMSPKVSEDDRQTEDDLARQKLGPRGVPGEPDTAKMTPQRKKKTPEVGDFDGHTA